MMIRVRYPKSLLSPLVNHLLIALISICVHGCITHESYSTGDFDYYERLDRAVEDILEDSKKYENRMVSGGQGNIDKGLSDFVQRHFSKANSIVLEHALQVRKAMDAVSFNDYIDRRKALLDHTLKLDPTLTMVNSDFASAIAFPSGRIFISQPLARTLYLAEGDVSPALLGILIHELVHVRHGHAIEQWATADGRNAWMSDKVWGALAKTTWVIPFLTIKYDMGYETTFKASKQLPQLSEYAADLGAITLLERNGFRKDGYTAFLKNINANASSSKEMVKEPFSWMKDRLECLKQFSATSFNKGLKTIIIGEDMDATVQVLHLEHISISLQELDHPDQLRNRNSKLAALSDTEMRKLVLGKIQRDMFVVCAIQNTFSTHKVVDGVLVTPDFDLNMFTLLY